jgi:hypothetical protein
MSISQEMRDIGEGGLLQVNVNIMSRFALSSPVLESDEYTEMSFYLIEVRDSGLPFIPPIGLAGTP